MGSKSKKKESSSPKDENQPKNGVKNDPKSDIGSDLQEADSDLEVTKRVKRDPPTISLGAAFLLAKTSEAFGRLDIEFDRYLAGKAVNIDAAMTDCQRFVAASGLTVAEYLDKLSNFALLVDDRVHKSLLPGH
jgi:hypothetical protein